jgi:hypothetical protein
MRTVLVAVLALVLAPSLVEAGGGSKQNSTITVRNTSTTEQLGVAVDPSAALQTALNSGTLTAQQFTALGGRIVAPGGSTSFSIKANNGSQAHTVAAAFLGDTSPTSATIGTSSITVNKGQTVNLSVSGTSTTQATITKL